MKAVINDTVIAEADKKDLIRIEGNWYFPPKSVNRQYLTPSSRQTTCFWKGVASYYDIKTDGKSSPDTAWYYPEPMDGATSRIGKDFSNYVAFWGDVKVVE